MKRFLRIALLLGAVIVLLSALSLEVTRAKAAPSRQNAIISASCGTWSVVPSPNANGRSGGGFRPGYLGGGQLWRPKNYWRTDLDRALGRLTPAYHSFADTA